MRGVAKGMFGFFCGKTYFNFFSSCQSMAMPMNAAPVSAMGWAKNTPFSSKKCGRISKNGISKITWRQAFKNMARSAFPVPWKKFPDTIPNGIMKKAAVKIRMAHAATCCNSRSLGANGATNASAFHITAAQQRSMNAPA